MIDEGALAKSERALIDARNGAAYSRSVLGLRSACSASSHPRFGVPHRDASRRRLHITAALTSQRAHVTWELV